MATYKFTKSQTSQTGTSADDVFTGNDLANVIYGGGSTAGGIEVAGDVYNVTKNDEIFGGEGNDTFVIKGKVGASVLHGGTSMKDFNGNATTDTVGGNTVAAAMTSNSDIRLSVAYRPGSSTSVDTHATVVSGYNAVDTIEFKKSGNYSELLFDGIERIELANGVAITLSAEAFEQNGDAADRGALNGGFYVAGTAGGKKETLIITTEYEDVEVTATIGGTKYYTSYSQTDFQLDDYSIADLFDSENVNVIFDVKGDAGSSDDDEDQDDDASGLPQYARVDGSNSSEIVKGSNGTDYATMRLGDDTYYGFDGNDILVGHGGADYLDGGAGNDYFLIGGFGSGLSGTTSKADDGQPEWIATGAKHDVIVGGTGTDTLRITAGIGADTQAHGTVILNDANFKQMEVVQVGGLVTRSNTENSAQQMINDHYYFAATGTVSNTSNASGNNGGTISNVVVDASGVTKNGLRFEGNADANTFIGTTKADTFVGNSGNDTFTGGLGADKFVFGLVHQMTAVGVNTAPQGYADVATSLSGTDTITDFSSLQGDKIVLNRDMFTMFNKATGVTADNIVVASSHVAADSNDYLLFDTSNNTLYFDADGSGSTAAVALVVLTGVSAVTASDFLIG